jgi:hypothetical protein
MFPPLHFGHNLSAKVGAKGRGFAGSVQFLIEISRATV